MDRGQAQTGDNEIMTQKKAGRIQTTAKQKGKRKIQRGMNRKKH